MNPIPVGTLCWVNRSMSHPDRVGVFVVVLDHRDCGICRPRCVGHAESKIYGTFHVTRWGDLTPINPPPTDNVEKRDLEVTT
jgi:hypothetical protein